ncbi:MAG: hypothetical protein ACRDZW_10145, partial [Acidimicrobiales bacterium]
VPVSPAGLTLSGPSTEPGGQLGVLAGGCEPLAPVSVSLGRATLPGALADARGAYAATLQLPDLPVGRYRLTVTCGPTYAGLVDVVVATSLTPPASTLAIFLFFILVMLVLFRRRRVPGRVPSA